MDSKCNKVQTIQQIEIKKSPTLFVHYDNCSSNKIMPKNQNEIILIENDITKKNTSHNGNSQQTITQWAFLLQTKIFGITFVLNMPQMHKRIWSIFKGLSPTHPNQLHNLYEYISVSLTRNRPLEGYMHPMS